jgi:hypothetical protein
MKIKTVLIPSVIFLVVASGMVSAQDSTPPNKRELSIYAAMGLSQEAVDWSIAGNVQGRDPNILSELIWKNVRGPAVNIGISLKLKTGILAKLESSYQKTIVGDVTDTDYQGDDRTSPSFHASVDCDKGFILNLNGEAGYNFKINSKIDLQGWIGYTFDQSLLYLQNSEGSGDQKLNSTYENFWKGITFSIGGDFQILNRLAASPRLTYKQLRYRAVGNWNLIDEFQHPESFKHDAKGFGLGGEIRVAYSLGEKLSLYLLPQYTFAETGRGTDRVFLQNGQVEKTQMNGANRVNFKLMLGVSLRLRQ